MKLKIAFAIAACLLASTPALSQAPAQPAYPREVAVPAIPGVVAAGAKWEMFWWGLDNADGIVATPDGGLMFAQQDFNRVRKVDPDGKTSVFLEDTRGVGSLGIDSQGRIAAVMREHPSLVYLYPERKLLADNYQGVPLTGAGDLVIDKKGGIYFTETRRMPTSRVHYFAPDGRIAFNFGDGMRTNGLTLSPDEKTLYLSNADVIVAFDLQPDGTGTNRRDFAKLQGERVAGDGMAVDADGRVYVTTRVGVQVISREGQLLGVIPTPRAPSTVAFSGPDKKMLFIVGAGAVDAAGVEHSERVAKTIYKLPMVAEGFKGRVK